MTTTHDAGTFVTPRDLDLFRTLVITRVLDVDQVTAVCRFQSVRRTNRRLLKLVRAGLLRRWFIGSPDGGAKALYGLSPQSNGLIGETNRALVHWKRDAIITGNLFLAHQQAVNEFFIQARFRPSGFVCEQWRNFREPISASIPLMPDAYFEVRRGSTVFPMFLEVDLGTETSKVWRRKVEFYLKLALSGEFERMFHEMRFQVVVVLPSIRRLDAIRAVIAKRTEKLFWLSSQDQVRSAGITAPIWLRPVGPTKVALV